MPRLVRVVIVIVLADVAGRAVLIVIDVGNFGHLVVPNLITLAFEPLWG